jgi:hypothetical protein
MGHAARHRWDMRAVEFFRVMKLDGELKAAEYRRTFNKANEFEKALERVMASVVKYNKENPPHDPIAKHQDRSGTPDGGTLPVGGPEAPMENAGPITG